MLDLHNICPRCLLESSGADFDLKEYMERVDPDDRTDPDSYVARLKVCEACDKLNAGLCMGCGCYVELRAYTAAKHCPYNKW